MKKSIIFTVFAAAIMLLSACQNEAEFNIDHLGTPLKAKFSADKSRVFINEDVNFASASVGAAKFEWAFEGGEPATSSEENPVVKYPTAGVYKVSLTVKDGAKQNIYSKEEYITVYAEECWKAMVMPTINFSNTASDKTLYSQLVPDHEQLIQQACFDVARWLFVCPDEMDVLKNIDYTVEDNDGISAKGGQAPNINIFFSATYLAKKKAEGLTDEKLLAEIKGVLYHEITHGYQFSPQGAGQYKQGDDFFGFIEGMADYVRYVSGFLTTADRNQGGHWNDGYKTSGFFMDWLHTKDPNFLNKLNHSAKTINPWSWDKATQQIAGKTVQVLWDEYQSDLKSGKITEIDEKLIKLRNGEDVDFGGDIPVTLTDLTKDNPIVTFKASEQAYPDWGLPAHAYDGDQGTQFFNWINETWLAFETTKKYNVTKVALSSSNNIFNIEFVFSADQFTLLGSNDGITWTEITKVADTGIVAFAEKKEFVFENTAYYKYHKIDMVADVEEKGRIVIGELEIFGTAE